jgi:hypothetical protein
MENEQDLIKYFKPMEELIPRDNINLDTLARSFYKILLLNPLDLKYNNIELRSSEIHGLGLFATADIPNGSIITFYPCDCPYTPGDNDCKIYYPDDLDDNDFKENIIEIKDRYGMCHKCSILGEYGMIGNPKNIYNTKFLGHMINDCTGNIYNGIEYSELLKEDCKLFRDIFIKYVKNVSEKCNCVISSHPNMPIMYIKTTKDIHNGMEILTYYNFAYWFNLTYDKSEQDLFNKINDNDLQDFLNQYIHIFK